MNNIIKLPHPMRSNLALSKDDVRLVILPGKDIAIAGQEDYLNAYELWHSIWSQTLSELDGLERLHSDQFTRQEMIACLFCGDLCVALACFRKVNLSNIVEQQDSWFIPWEESLMNELGAKYPNGMIISYLSVHPDYRKTKSNSNSKLPIDTSVLLAEVLAYMATYTGADVTFGVTRNNRSVNKMAYFGGAIPLAENKMHHGVAVDLIALFPENTAVAMKNFSPHIGPLWQNKVSYVSNPLNGRHSNREKKDASVS